MSSPRHCARCDTPFTDESGSELCPVCQSSTEDARPHLITPNVNAFRSGSGEPSAIAGTPRPDVLEEPHLQSTVTADEQGGRVDTDAWSAGPRPIANLCDTAEIPRTPRLPLAPPGYQLLGRLGGGCMGDVFLAREIAAERTVAMKFVRAAHNPVAVERFLTEVRALARIDDPHIVKVLATDFYSATPYFTMEYVAGGTLADRVAEAGPLPANEAAQVMVPIARAVHAAHCANILHRDLKPSNILRGTDGSPKVVDFGLAKRTDREDDLTLISGPLGTPSFMPPEQVSKAHGTLGPQSDVYGLGATLYYLLGGRPPFVGDSTAAIATKVVSEPPPRLRGLRPEVPGGLEGIVVKCLEKDPAARYPSALALAEDLEGFLAGKKKLLAPELTRMRRAALWLKRHRLAASAVVAVVVLLAAVWLAWTPPVARNDPEPQPSGTRDNAEAPAGPSDPAAAIRRELGEFKLVRLLHPDGTPRVQGWPLGVAELSARPDDGGTCSIISTEARVLLVLDDPGVDRYRITVELREAQKGGLLQNNPQNTKVDAVGLVFGYALQHRANGEKTYSMETIGYSDFDAKGKAPNRRELQLHEVAVREEHPLKARGLHTLHGPYVPLPPAVPGPPWRKVTVEITPNLIRVVEPAGFRPYPVEELNNHRHKLAEDMAGITMLKGMLQAKLPKEQVDILTAKLAAAQANFQPLPAWSPRMPIGIWCKDAEVAFRNLVIEALR